MVRRAGADGAFGTGDDPAYTLQVSPPYAAGLDVTLTIQEGELAVTGPGKLASFLKMGGVAACAHVQKRRLACWRLAGGLLEAWSLGFRVRGLRIARRSDGLRNDKDGAERDIRIGATTGYGDGTAEKAVGRRLTAGTNRGASSVERGAKR